MNLLMLVEQAYRKTSWHGPNLRASFRGLDARQAAWRPRPGRHNIAEQVVHAAYWKYVVRRRLTGAKRGSFPLKGSNWFPVDSLTAVQWSEMAILLDNEHVQLCQAVAAQIEHAPNSAGAKRVQPAGDATHWRLITGIAAHDVYHAGQIRLLRALQGV